MRRPVTAALCLAGVLLAGCTTTGASSTLSAAPAQTSPTSGSPSSSPSPTLTAAGEYRPLPLDAYRFSDEQSEVYYKAVQLLRIPCLAKYGFTPYPDPPSPPEDLGNDAYVTEDGYGVVDTPADRAYDEAMNKYNAEYEKNPPSAAYLLVDGGTQKRDGVRPPSGISDKTVNGKKVYPTGCTGWAQDQISTKDRNSGQPRELRPIYDAAWAAYEADPVRAELQGQWSSCMREKGYSFATPEQAPYGPQPKPKPDAQGRAKITLPKELAPQVEQAIARADLGCRAKTSYDDKDYALQAKHQRDLIEQNATMLSELQKNLADELRAATAVISGASPSP